MVLPSARPSARLLDVAFGALSCWPPSPSLGCLPGHVTFHLLTPSSLSPGFFSPSALLDVRLLCDHRSPSLGPLFPCQLPGLNPHPKLFDVILRAVTAACQPANPKPRGWSCPFRCSLCAASMRPAQSPTMFNASPLSGSVLVPLSEVSMVYS